VKVFLEGDLIFLSEKCSNGSGKLDEFVFMRATILYMICHPLRIRMLNDTDVVMSYMKRIEATILLKDKEGGSWETGFSVLWSHSVILRSCYLLKIRWVRAEENINNSIQALEFDSCVWSVHFQLIPRKNSLSGRTGRTEWIQVGDITRELAGIFRWIGVKLAENQAFWISTRLLSLPTKRVFQERDKFILDQYIMQEESIVVHWYG